MLSQFYDAAKTAKKVITHADRAGIRAYKRGVQGVHCTRARKSSGSRVFFWSLPNFEQEMGLNFSEDLFFSFFFFFLPLILGKNWV